MGTQFRAHTSAKDYATADIVVHVNPLPSRSDNNRDSSLKFIMPSLSQNVYHKIKA